MYSEMSDLKTEMAELKQRVGSVEEQGGMYLNTTYDCFITKTCPCNVYPLISHFYIAKLGFAGIYLRGMAGKFVDTSAIRKSNALLNKRFAYFQAAISYEYISEILCNLK